MKKQRIGVYICHCGGNISDYVDVEQLSKLLQKETGVIVSKDVMFACSDSNQKEMIQDIHDRQLDAIVVASCSPKLHIHTFRNVALRAGINQYNYTQVNIREQCSWAHSDKPKDASVKAYGLIRAGINRVSYSEALESVEIKACRAVAVIGAGVAGMRAAIDLAGMGNHVYLIEKNSFVGGHLPEAGKLYPTGEEGKQVVEKLYNTIKSIPEITLFVGARLDKVSGSVGNIVIEVCIPQINLKPDEKASKFPDGDQPGERLKLNVGSVLVTTGFDFYKPKTGEFGYGQTENVLTLPDFKKLVDTNTGQLIFKDKAINKVAFIYCVGNRQEKGENKYCSRQCCTAAIHTSIQIHEKFKGIKAFHLYRDIRTYGKQEILYQKSSGLGDIYLKFGEKEPPQIQNSGDNLVVKVKDYLTAKKEISFDADMVVLVTGMVSREDSGEISGKLKIPVGTDRFYNEIHPKLKPVETVIGGVYIGGACQGPKNISESVQSALSGAAKINALIKRGKIALEPVVARINNETCIWCGKCSGVCEYDALKPVELAGKQIAEVNPATCKGCGICAPVCPADAIEIVQYTNNEIESMIDGFMSEMEISDRKAESESTGREKKGGMKEYPQVWNQIASSLEGQKMTISGISEHLGLQTDVITYHLMTMNKYSLVEPAGLDSDEVYFYYKLKK